MRVKVTGPVEVKRGQTVDLHAHLPKDADHAFLEIFTAVGEFEPSPFVPQMKIGIMANDRPTMVNATTLRLNPSNRDKVLTLTADEDCSFYIMQDVDRHGDPLVSGRILIHGKFTTKLAQARRWLLRRLGR